MLRRFFRSLLGFFKGPPSPAAARLAELLASGAVCQADVDAARRRFYLRNPSGGLWARDMFVVGYLEMLLAMLRQGQETREGPQLEPHTFEPADGFGEPLRRWNRRGPCAERES